MIILIDVYLIAYTLFFLIYWVSLLNFLKSIEYSKKYIFSLISLVSSVLLICATIVIQYLSII